MGNLTPLQERNRDRVESLIGLMAPAFDLVLAVGERISRIVEPEDYGYQPARRPDESEWGPHAQRLRLGNGEAKRDHPSGD